MKRPRVALVKNVKAQNALEYLISYSWMILAAIVVVAIVFYSGVLAAGASVTPACSLPPGIACAAYKLESGTGYMDLRLRQSLPRPINVTQFKCTQETGVPADGWADVPNGTMRIGEEKWIASTEGMDGGVANASCYHEALGNVTVFPDARVGQHFSGKLWIRYTELDTGATRTVSGDFAQNYE